MREKSGQKKSGQKNVRQKNKNGGLRVFIFLSDIFLSDIFLSDIFLSALLVLFTRRVSLPECLIGFAAGRIELLKNLVEDTPNSRIGSLITCQLQ